MNFAATTRLLLRPSAGCRGLRGAFTFIEMLLSLVIMGFVMVIVAGATSIGTKSYEANQTDARLGEAGRVILERIAREIRSASSVTCAANRLTIVPPSGESVTQIDYVLEGGQFYCDRTETGGAQRYTLLGSEDDVSVTAFEITVSTAVVEEQTVTAMVTVELTLQSDGRSLVVSASACPRQNITP